MAGNVWEMTASPMQPYPYSEADDLEARDGEALWVMRGGSFADGLGNIRAAVRGGVDECAQQCHRFSARHQRPPLCYKSVNFLSTNLSSSRSNKQAKTVGVYRTAWTIGCNLNRRWKIEIAYPRSNPGRFDDPWTEFSRGAPKVWAPSAYHAGCCHQACHRQTCPGSHSCHPGCRRAVF